MSPTNDTTGRRIAARAKELEAPMIAFLRDIVAARGLSGQEEACVRRGGARDGNRGLRRGPD
jgi:hypothetical protein